MSNEELEQAPAALDAESAPAEVDAQDPQPEESNRNPGVERRISTLTSKLYHKDTELQQLKAENETLKKVGQQPRQEQQVEIDLPDEALKYDEPEKYKQQLEAFHKAAAAKAYAETQSKYQKEESDRQAKAEQEQKQKQYQGVVDNYIENGLKDGINEDRMLANEEVLRKQGISPDLAKYLYGHESGAKVVDFLASNPDKLAALSGQNLIDAAVSLSSEIIPAALATKSQTTNAPDPAAPTVGGGVPPGDGLRWIGGATFE